MNHKTIRHSISCVIVKVASEEIDAVNVEIGLTLFGTD